MGPLAGRGPPPGSQVPGDAVLKLALCLFLLECRQGRARAQPPCREEEYPVGTECCPRCSPGYHVKQACSELMGTVCQPCLPGTYTAHPNGLSQCLPCRDCDPAMGMDTRQGCSSTQDTVCGCRHGYFCQAKDGDHCSACWPHTVCRPGQRVQKRGTPSQDTVCADCPPGTFSLSGTLEQCLPWTRCREWLEVEAEPGTGSRDASCSFSWWFYPLLGILATLPVLITAVVCLRIRRKRPTGTVNEAKAMFQWKRRGDGESDPAVTEALHVPPNVTTVAVEETLPGLKAGPNG